MWAAPRAPTLAIRRRGRSPRRIRRPATPTTSAWRTSPRPCHRRRRGSRERPRAPTSPRRTAPPGAACWRWDARSRQAGADDETGARDVRSRPLVATALRLQPPSLGVEADPGARVEDPQPGLMQVLLEPRGGYQRTDGLSGHGSRLLG